MDSHAIHAIDLSHLSTLAELEQHFHQLANSATPIQSLHLTDNQLVTLPEQIYESFNETITSLDVSNNHLLDVRQCLENLPQLLYLDAHNNRLGEQTDSDINCTTDPMPVRKILTLNLGGNRLKKIPLYVFNLTNLTKLHLGANQIQRIPSEITRMQKLENLYLGGNQLDNIPPELANLKRLINLNLSDNRLTSVPACLGQLTELRCLELHTNQLQTLPLTIIKLVKLEVLSLRNNPLVVAFARQSAWSVPSLTELSGRRCLQFLKPEVLIGKSVHLLPRGIRNYLNSARTCENPKCCGVYFSHHVEGVKFVDFCGRFRLPFAQFLCSPQCSDDGDGEADMTEQPVQGTNEAIRRVLIG